MAENAAKLELPEPGKRKTRGWGRRLGVLIGLGLIGGAAAYGAWMYYSVQTPSAVIESNPLVLGTPVPAQIAEVLVKKNERVSAGQALIRLHARTDASNAAEARAQVASLRNLLPPPADMEDVARRVADAQAAEQDVVNRIMQARASEEEAARDVQHKAEEHARAQLELRRLDALSAQYSVPRALYDKARTDEHGARHKLEKARAAREEYSRVRAATEGELSRIKTELAELKKAGRQAGEHAQQSATAAPRMPSAQASPDVIVAPTHAVVTDVFTQPGTWAQPDQELIALTPDAAPYSVTAWFPEHDGARIQPGQVCSVFVLEVPGKSFSGKVERVLPAGSLAPKFPHAAPGQSRQIPVRVRFADNDAGNHAELKSGMRAAVRVHNFAPPWARLDALAGKARGR
jgi:membrane fusion protein (multidrug efflux system)